MPGRQRVPRAEIRAATMAIRAADEDPTMRQKTLSSMNADLCQEYGNAYDNHQGENRVGLVKAHSEWVFVWSGMCTAQELHGNALAYEMAGLFAQRRQLDMKPTMRV